MKRVLYLFGSVLCALGLLASPLSAVAEGLGDELQQTTQPPVIITELQTGGPTASDEFIELYNRSDKPVNIAGWQIRYINSTTTTGATTLLATITPATGDTLLLESGDYFVLHTAGVTVPVTVAEQVFSAALSKTDKTVALFARDETTCEMIVQDAVAWEVTPGTTTGGEGSAVVVTSAQSSKEKLLQRFRDASENYIDTNHNSLDFIVSVAYAQASPGTDNAILSSSAPDIGASSNLASFAAANCTVPEPEDPAADPPSGESPPSVEDSQGEDPKPKKLQIPASNIGLKSPLLSELLPNPASPQTDANDEFIELYNPNDRRFALTGYVLEVGTTTKRRYAFPADTWLEPKAFFAFFSSETGLALSNSGSQARLIDPLGRVLAESEPYTSAKDNQSWLLANGVWQWSVKPSPNAVNIVSQPAPKKKAPTQAKNTSAVKGRGAEKAKTDTQDTAQDSQQTVAATTLGTPVHSGVLALVVITAVLYGAYEYRHDVANKIRKFRSDRAARRQDRPGA